MRLTELAPAQVNPPAQGKTSAQASALAQEDSSAQVNPPAQGKTSAQASAPVVYGSPQWARRSFTKGFAGSDFSLQADGTLRCPAGHPLSAQERRPEHNGAVRILYSARLCHCRPCPKRGQCQESATTIKARRVSAVFWPLSCDPSLSAQLPFQPVETPSRVGEPPRPPPPPQPAPYPVLWGDWERCQLRRRWIRLLRTQTVVLTLGSAQAEEKREAGHQDVQTRAQRAHGRLSWEERMARNARLATACPLHITIYGLPASFAQYVRRGLVRAA
jgi:hypothetical protein